MSGKLNHWFRTAQHRSTAFNRTYSNIKARRLIVEHMENRLLLSGDFQTGIDLQLNNLQDNSNLIIIPANSDSGKPLFYNSQRDLTGTFAAFTNTNGAPAMIHNSDLGNANIPRGLCGGTDKFNLIGDDNLSPYNPDEGMIDVSQVARSPSNNMPPQEPKASTIAETKETPVAPLKNVSSQIGVDGARGRSQMFELSMATGREAKSDMVVLLNGLAEIIYGESNLDTLRLLNKSSVTPHGQSKSEAAQLLNELSLPSSSESQFEGALLPSKFIPEARSAAKPNAVKILNEPAISTHTTKQAQAIPNPQIILARADIAGYGSEESQAGQTETSLTNAGSGSAALPAQGAPPADDGRQAVFAEMGQDAEQTRPQPSYLDENHRTKAVGLAVVAIAGQFLSQRWLRRVAPSQTCLIPPRRRDSAR